MKNKDTLIKKPKREKEHSKNKCHLHSTMVLIIRMRCHVILSSFSLLQSTHITYLQSFIFFFFFFSESNGPTPNCFPGKKKLKEKVREKKKKKRVIRKEKNRSYRKKERYGGEGSNDDEYQY